MKKNLKKWLKAPLKGLPILLPTLFCILVFFAGWHFGLPDQETKPSTTTDNAKQTWTCSMHPQIRQPNFGPCPICEMDLIPLENDSGQGGLREVSVSQEAAALLNLKVSPVTQTTARAEVSLFGKIAYDERKVSTITTRIEGRIDQLYVDFTGAKVRKNDHLARLYSPEIYVAQKELIGAQNAQQQNRQTTSQTAQEIRNRLYSSAREKLRLLDLSEQQINAIAQQKTPTEHITIYSPQNGLVTAKFINQGQYVKTGDPLFEIADLSKVWLELEAYESDLSWLRYAQDVAFTVEALPGQTFHGRVAYIDPQIDPKRRVTTVRLNVENNDQLLKPGMFARAQVDAQITSAGNIVDPSLHGKWISPMHPEIIKDQPGQCDICGMDLVSASDLGFVKSPHQDQDNPLMVPESAILQTGTRAVVYVRLPEHTAPVFEGREIVLGAKVGNQYIVKSGLSKGELVLTQGAFKLDSELQIKAKPSMMSPNAGLEEQPAHSAPQSLAGQWQPALRAYSRLHQAVHNQDQKPTKKTLTNFKNSLAHINTTTLPADTLPLWREFSNRLQNAATIAESQIEQNPQKALGILSRAIEEAGRYLGLPSQPLDLAHGKPETIQSLQTILDHYHPLKKALVDDKPTAAATAARELAAHINILQPTNTFSELMSNAQALARENHLEQQRIIFQQISNQLIELIQENALDQLDGAYLIHCPMAFENQGADWLSAQPEVYNPYFGSSMLRCGTVTAALSHPQTNSSPTNTDTNHQHQHQHSN